MDKKALRFVIYHDTRIELIEKFLHIYNGYLSAMGKSTMTERTIGLASFYIHYGYSDDTKHRYKDSYGLSMHYVSILNNELKKRGFLEDRTKSHRTRNLNKELLNIRNYIVLDDPSDIFRIIGFVFKRREDNG